MNLVEESLELLDPTPNVHNLFVEYDKLFFDGSLGRCEVKWSPQMTSCAGLCSFDYRSGFCSIRLSKPLLRLRPRKDLIETLLHEMIHAYLFIKEGCRDRDGHGPNFHHHMQRINALAKTNITVRHSFFDEVAACKKHWWLCNGICRYKPPYYGIVKRSKNRAPSPNDFWYAKHQQYCGGSFIKIKQPIGYKPRKTGMKSAKVGRLPSPVERMEHPTYARTGRNLDGNALEISLTSTRRMLHEKWKQSTAVDACDNSVNDITSIENIAGFSGEIPKYLKSGIPSYPQSIRIFDEIVISDSDD